MRSFCSLKILVKAFDKPSCDVNLFCVCGIGNYMEVSHRVYFTDLNKCGKFLYLEYEMAKLKELAPKPGDASHNEEIHDQKAFTCALCKIRNLAKRSFNKHIHRTHVRIAV